MAIYSMFEGFCPTMQVVSFRMDSKGTYDSNIITVLEKDQAIMIMHILYGFNLLTADD